MESRSDVAQAGWKELHFSATVDTQSVANERLRKIHQHFDSKMFCPGNPATAISEKALRDVPITMPIAQI